MDDRLLALYEQELRHLRESAAEFARAYPKIAGRLDVDPAANTASKDPYVERLLEGFAFLTSRVMLKFEAEFPRFTQSILETIYPHYLAPTPSMAIVQFRVGIDDAALAKGFRIPRDTQLRSTFAPEDRTECRYRTAHDLQLWPLEIEEVEYLSRGLDTLELRGQAAGRSALRIRLRCGAGLDFSQLAMDDLTFFINAPEPYDLRIYEQIFGHGLGALVRPVAKESVPVRLPPDAVHPVGFQDKEKLLPYDGRSFHGHRLLHEYFAMPQRFLFFCIKDLQPVLRRAKTRQVDLILPLDDVENSLENFVKKEHLALFCTPAINLFNARADRIALSDRAPEYQVIVDRTRPLDFEVYQVHQVTGLGMAADDRQIFRPFYSASDFDADQGGGAYFSVHRVPRLLSSRERERGARSTYLGTEAFLSLVDGKAAPFHHRLAELAVEVLCTNRDLPMKLPKSASGSDFVVESEALVQAVTCLRGPTAPRYSHVEGELAWRAVSHLSLNYLSILDEAQGRGASALQDLLKLYGDPQDAVFKKQIGSLHSVFSRPVIKRIGGGGPLGFARGLEVSVEFDETAAGGGIFLLGAVLDRFLAQYVSLNSFTATVVKSVQRGEVVRWKPRSGTRHIL